jgi:EAL domain-containing protein (putative c-di-GMP-specific phosphodiesterase class I)
MPALTPLRFPTVEVHLQPIVCLRTGRMVAAEALSRLEDHVPVLNALAAAADGRHLDRFEAHLLRHALAARHRLPHDRRLSLNVLPDSLTGAATIALLNALPSLEGLVLEIHSEHDWYSDAALLGYVHRLRRRGALLALDGASVGFHGLMAMCRLRPDWVKIDRSLVTGASDDPLKVAALDLFVDSAHRGGSVVVAVGVETEADLTPLRAAGVELAQGHWLGHPTPGSLRGMKWS